MCAEIKPIAEADAVIEFFGAKAIRVDVKSVILWLSVDEWLDERDNVDNLWFDEDDNVLIFKFL